MLNSTAVMAVKVLRVLKRSERATRGTVASELGVSESVVGVVCTRLAKAGIVVTRPGQPHGGVTLVRDLSTVSIRDVSIAISGEQGCLLRELTCTVEAPCRICRGVLKVLEASVEEVAA